MKLREDLKRLKGLKSGQGSTKVRQQTQDSETRGDRDHVQGMPLQASKIVVPKELASSTRAMSGGGTESDMANETVEQHSPVDLTGQASERKSEDVPSELVSTPKDQDREMDEVEILDSPKAVSGDSE